MRNSQRSKEGLLTIDHRAGEGIGPKGSLLGPGTLCEIPIYTCSHCQRGVIVNPMRTRERAYCPNCDHVICDQCEAVRVATGACRPFAKIAEKLQNGAVRAEQQRMI